MPKIPITQCERDHCGGQILPDHVLDQSLATVETGTCLLCARPARLERIASPALDADVKAGYRNRPASQEGG